MVSWIKEFDGGILLFKQLLDGWQDGWTDGWQDGRMDGWVGGYDGSNESRHFGYKLSCIPIINHRVKKKTFPDLLSELVNHLKTLVIFYR